MTRGKGDEDGMVRRFGDDIRWAVERLATRFLNVFGSAMSYFMRLKRLWQSEGVHISMAVLGIHR